MPARSEAIALLVVAALHLIVGMVHHYAHVIAGVQNTTLELLFILLVVAIALWAAVYVAWKRNLRTGAALFSLSMAASFLFGYLLHFVVDSPDHHAKVMEIHSGVFFHSAVGLALVEFAGLVFGSYIFLLHCSTIVKPARQRIEGKGCSAQKRGGRGKARGGLLDAALRTGTLMASANPLTSRPSGPYLAPALTFSLCCRGRWVP